LSDFAAIAERLEEIHGRVHRVEDDLYRIDPEQPGMALRMDRLERLMDRTVTVVWAGGGLAVAWQLLQFLTALAVKGATP
jgi:hypothetical protein